MASICFWAPMIAAVPPFGRACWSGPGRRPYYVGHGTEARRLPFQDSGGQADRRRHEPRGKVAEGSEGRTSSCR